MRRSSERGRLLAEVSNTQSEDVKWSTILRGAIHRLQFGCDLRYNSAHVLDAGNHVPFGQTIEKGAVGAFRSNSIS